MPAAQWSHHDDRPMIEVVLAATGGQHRAAKLLADTGAGRRNSVFELILDESDCLQSGGMIDDYVELTGAYSGTFPVYRVNVRIPQLSFDEYLPAVGVSHLPEGFDGIAGFKFLNRFHFGNSGNPDAFCIEFISLP